VFCFIVWHTSTNPHPRTRTSTPTPTHTQEVDTINAYVELRNVPDGLRQRIKNYYEYVYIKQYGLGEETILASMPTKIQDDLARKNMRALETVPFFNRRYRDEAFLAAVSHKLQLRTYTPGSTLIFQNEKQRELMVVKAGQVELYTKVSE